jgi:hypothetical protein
MKRIKLGGKYGLDKFALVDDEDFDKFNKYKWHSTKKGYALHTDTSVKPKKNILMHRLIMNCRKGLEVDHIYHNTLDNRKQNLRITTRIQNHQNTIIHKINKSGYKGVTKHKHSGKWESRIKYQGKKLHIGLFTNPRHAALAYDMWAKELFGEYAYLNFQE